MKNKLVIANWKMNPDSPEKARVLFRSSINKAKNLRKTTLAIAPPFTFLPLFSQKEKKVKLASQSVSHESIGAFTGEISAYMLSHLGVRLSIVGHSERRRLGETDEVISKKIKSLLKVGITPVVCVGELARDGHGEYLSFLENQIRKSLSGISKNDASKLVIAYEPVWAIGGKTSNDAMTAQDLHEMTIFVRKITTSIFGRNPADSIAIIYGGSVKADNASELVREGNISGFLVGSASLDSKVFGEILSAVEKS